MSNQLVKRMEESVRKAEQTERNYDTVLTSDGERDVTLTDGRTTANLNKRVAHQIGPVIQEFKDESGAALTEIAERLDQIKNDGVTADMVVVGDSTLDVFAKNISRYTPLPYDAAKEYVVGERVTLTTGEIAQNTVAGNATDPNVDMTGWMFADAALNTTKLQRENVSVWDFFTPEEYATFIADPPRYDAAPNIQAFFNYISANDVGTAYCSGQFYIYQPLILGGATGTKTKEIVGFLKVTYYYTAPEIDTVLTIQTGSNCTWLGFINVACNSANSLNYANRIVKNGIRLGGEYANTHFTIDGLFAENGAKEFGVIIDNNTTGSNIGKIRSSRCGCGYATSGYIPSLYSDFTIDSTVGGSTNQYSILNTVGAPSVTSNIPLMAEINGQLYFVLERPDTLGANKYKVFPTLPSTNSATKLRWVFGGGTYVRGSDASVINIGNISSSTCSVSLHLAALYPPNITSLTTQGNYCGLILGNSLTAGFVGGSLGEIYCEALELNVVQLPRTGVSFPILNNVALNLSKCFNLGNWRSTNDLMSDNYKWGVTTLIDSNYSSPQKVLSGTSITVDMTSFDTHILSKGTATAARTVNLALPNDHALRLFQNSTKTVVIESPTGVFTGTVTFKPPTGVTINGGTSDLVYAGITLFMVVAYDANTIFVIPLGQKNSAEVTYNPQSIAAAGTVGDYVTTTVTLLGAVVGDPVQAAFSQYSSDIEISAAVSSANTVTVKFKNTGASPVDLPSGTLKVKLI